MKTNNLFTAIPAMIALLILGACDHSVEMETVVHEDGGLDKTIILTDDDSSRIDTNYFGIGPSSGWDSKAEKVKEKDGDGTDIRITLSKHFPSAEAMNQELDQDVDTLFRVNASFEKKFRWFYTYLFYRETIRAADRFTQIDQSAYFTPEEYEFIKRLPAEGSPVSKADSLFAENLNKKIFDEYSRDAIIEEHFSFMRQKFIEYNLPETTLSELDQQRDLIVSIMLEEESDDEDSIIPMDDELFFVNLVDSLVTELPPGIADDYLRFNEGFEKRLSFMSWVSDGTFSNKISMPWKIVNTNADSIHDNQLYWYPPNMKFLLTDYSMEAESRKMNIWAIVVSLLILVITVYLYVKKN